MLDIDNVVQFPLNKLYLFSAIWLSWSFSVVAEGDTLLFAETPANNVIQWDNPFKNGDLRDICDHPMGK